MPLSSSPVIRQRLIIAVLTFVAPLTSAAGQPLPRPTPIRTFGNWAVACDNGLRCQAVSLLPTDEGSVGVSLVVVRDTGPAAVPTVTLVHLFDGRHGAASITVDGRTLAEGRLDADCELKTEPSLARKIVAALTAGRRLRLTGDDDAADSSLDGATAAFRYMDAQQGRAGGVTALVASGPLPATSVPVGSIPTIRAPRPPSGHPAVTIGLRTALWARSRCEGPVGGDAAFETHALDARRTLVLVSCGEDGPYNRFQDPYVVTGSAIAVAPFDSPVGMGERGAPPQIVTGGWDVPTGTLTSYERGRALGDCASQETFVWDGSIFRLIEKDELDECRGGLRLLPLWRATPSFGPAPTSTAPDPTTGTIAPSAADRAPLESIDRYATDALHLVAYAEAEIDLNGDGVPEGLVLTTDADRCGSGGCDLFILARDGSSWRVVTETSVTHAPIRVLHTSHRGWRDVAVRVAGGGILPGHDVRLAFDGRSYPENPTVPPATPIARPGGRIVIPGPR